MTVVAFRAPPKLCKCGSPGKLRTLSFRGMDVGTAIVCNTCVAVSDDFLDSVRPVFQAMLDCGVDRDTANATMTFMIDAMEHA